MQFEAVFWENGEEWRTYRPSLSIGCLFCPVGRPDGRVSVDFAPPDRYDEYGFVCAPCFGVGRTRAKKCEIQEEWFYERK